MKLFQFLVLCVAAACSVYAAPANPAPALYTQPDGSETPLIFAKGNQIYHWLADEKGFHVVRDEQGWYNYGVKTEDGDIVSSGIKVGSKNPKKAGIVPNLIHDEHKRPTNQLQGIHGDSVKEHRSLLHVPEAALCGFSGTEENPCKLTGVVFLVQFNNHLSRNLPDRTDYDLLFNAVDLTDSVIAPTGSVHDVFLENSYFTFHLKSTVTDWIKVNRSEEQTVAGNVGLNMPETRETWRQAIAQCDQDKTVCPFNLDDYDEDNNNKFDLVVILHSGSPAEAGGVDCETNRDLDGRIWSHATSYPLYVTQAGKRVDRFYVASAVFEECPPGGAWTKWGIARVGVIAHECAHFLGLPDLYDTTGGTGVGSYDLQANMWGWYGNQYYPPLMGAWSKLKLGWSQVTHVKGAGTHNFQLAKACEYSEILYIDHRLEDGEYFLIEYRYPCGYDEELSHHKGPVKDRSGVAIWHIDESGKQNINYQSEGVQGTDDDHYVVALVQGDGGFHMEKGENKGDRYDLFMHCPDYNCYKAYKIDNGGVTNTASSFPYPTTRGYSTGAAGYDTGISIQVGKYWDQGSNTFNEAIDIEIILVGDDTDENTFPGPDKIGNSPGDVPTQPPVQPTPPPINPTPSPTYDPTPDPTPGPTHEPSPGPTPPPTPGPTHEPSPGPTPPPTPGPTPPPTPGPTHGPTPGPTDPPTLEPTPGPTPPPSHAPTPGPTPLPTSGPTHLPTPGPTDPPTPDPTHGPTDHPTPAPVVPPTSAPVVPATPAPVIPATPAPVTAGSKFEQNIDYKHNEVEIEADWENRVQSHEILNGSDGDIVDYFEHYGITIPESHHVDLTGTNAFDLDSSKLLNIVIDCRMRDNEMKVSYTGVGRNAGSRAKIKAKPCNWFEGNNEKFCPLVDMDSNRAVVDPASGETVRPRIWQTCHQECEEYTHCAGLAR